MDLTPDRIQDISVRVVAGFMGGKTSLNEGITKEAMDHQLNPDQIKRVVEATNSIAYLRQLQDAPDRTFEFPVASYGEVLKGMVMPDEGSSASGVGSGLGMMKQAEEIKEGFAALNFDSEIPTSMTEHEKLAMIARNVLSTKGHLQKMAYEKEDIRQRLITKASSVSKDPKALEKLAEIVSEEDFYKMSKLVGLEKSAEESVSLGVFYEKELKDVKELYSLYKQAHETLREEERLQSFLNRSVAVLEKKAFGPFKPIALGLSGRIASGIGKVVAAPFKWTGNKIMGAVGNRIDFGKALEARTDKMVDSAVAAAKAKTPGIEPNRSALKAEIGPKAKANMMADYAMTKQKYGAAAAERMHGYKNPLLGKVTLGGLLTTGLAPMYLKHDSYGINENLNR